METHGSRFRPLRSSSGRLGCSTPATPICSKIGEIMLEGDSIVQTSLLERKYRTLVSHIRIENEGPMILRSIHHLHRLNLNSIHCPQPLSSVSRHIFTISMHPMITPMNRKVLQLPSSKFRTCVRTTGRPFPLNSLCEHAWLDFPLDHSRTVVIRGRHPIHTR